MGKSRAHRNGDQATSDATSDKISKKLFNPDGIVSSIEVRWWLRAFDTNSDRLVWELELPPHVTLGRLQALLGVDQNNPMYDVFRITPSQAREICDLEAVDLGRPNLELFVEADAE